MGQPSSIVVPSPTMVPTGAVTIDGTAPVNDQSAVPTSADQDTQALANPANPLLAPSAVADGSSGPEPAADATPAVANGAESLNERVTAVAGESASQEVTAAESESLLDGLINVLSDLLDFGTPDEPVDSEQPEGRNGSGAQAAQNEGGLLSLVPFSGQTGANLIWLILVGVLLLVAGFGLRRLQRRKRI